MNAETLGTVKIRGYFTVTPDSMTEKCRLREKPPLPVGTRHNCGRSDAMLGGLSC